MRRVLYTITPPLPLSCGIYPQGSNVGLIFIATTVANNLHYYLLNSELLNNKQIKQLTNNKKNKMKRLLNYLSVVGIIVLLGSMCCLLSPSMFYVACIGMMIGFILFVIGMCVQ